MLSSCPKISPPTLSYNPESQLAPLPPPILHVKNSQQPDWSVSLSPPANKSVAAIVFGDQSQNSRLYPLTKRRSEAAIPIAGNYRLVDAVLSNCINSNINKIFALTQFNSTSLNSHIARAYSARLLKDGFVEVIAAYQSPEDNAWFQGTADAIRKCLWVLEEKSVNEFLVLPGHHLYKMDYQQLIDEHRRSNAGITVSLFRTPENEDLGFGIYELNAQNQVLQLRENPKGNTNPQSIIVDKCSDNVFPSMGIYVINKDVMRQLLIESFPSVHDLNSQVIPGAISLGMKINGYVFDGYWEDMRSVEAYYRASIESIRNTSYNFYDRDFPIYTLPRYLPPTLLTDAIISDSIIGDGCILSKCRIKGSVAGMRTKICNNAVVEDSVILGSDAYEQHEMCDGEGIGIPIGIGEGSHIKKAIVDKNARIGKNVMIINRDNVQEGNMEENGYVISAGIIVIVRNAVIPDGTII